MVGDQEQVTLTGTVKLMYKAIGGKVNLHAPVFQLVVTSASQSIHWRYHSQHHEMKFPHAWSRTRMDEDMGS